MKRKIDIYDRKFTSDIQREFIEILKELGAIDQEDEYAPKKEGVVIIEFIESC